MTETSLTARDAVTTLAGMKRMIVMGIMPCLAIAAPGCVTVNAPDKPIEINLNISVTAETVVKFDAQAKSLIQQNPGIF